MSELQALPEFAGDLTGAARVEDPALAVRAERVAKRLAEGSFHVTVVGEFKRGKSTLVNALLGAEVLPTGVLPLTAVMTEVVNSIEGATVVASDGGSSEIGLDSLADYVTEAGNPGNERGGGAGRGSGTGARAGFGRGVGRYAGSRVVIVGHDVVNRALLARLASNTADEPDAIPQRTGCWNKLEHVDSQWVATVIDALPDDGQAP